MRLLHRDAGGHLRQTFFSSHVPPYAILSHTWGADEVSFNDVRKGRYEGKEGYRKIRFCLWQAAHDGLQYCWIDTCCIDRSNSTEVSDAINSQFRWYQQASKCYVYLADVPEKRFQASRWFTRGWTLSELLAPRIVEFYSSEGIKLGDKFSLREEIRKRTHIPIKALQGMALRSFGVEQRISWIENRETARPEDMAYSLLGLFDIRMPPIYGEGHERAEARLRKLISERRRQQAWETARDLIFFSSLIYRLLKVFALLMGGLFYMVHLLTFYVGHRDPVWARTNFVVEFLFVEGYFPLVGIIFALFYVSTRLSFTDAMFFTSCLFVGIPGLLDLIHRLV